ncbi:MAG: TIGR03032 family protein, partial [Pseudomonadota bacterium]
MTQRSASQQVPLRSVFTTSFADVLRQLNVSLAVSTYQAGKVVLVRCDADGTSDDSPAGVVNTHFRNFDRPMGLAVNGNRLSIGGANTVWEYRNQPGVAARLQPPGKHDACYLARSIHVTGNIDIHEMAWSNDDELWLVNTRFCCLCTLDVDHSFSPRWRPPFVSALAPEDRCHLNGLAMVDGQPKYVTALGETDTEGGWRANKANGGILMDVESNEVLLRGLSMPHSPRWYNGKLWVLESGEGTLARVNPGEGSWQTVAEVPGFSRGIDFVGPLAFIGLSKVRESATFSGIPIVSRLRERTCGVWVVNIETGETVAFLRFETGVEEIFGVQVLQASYPDMLEWGDPHIANSYVLPDEALADVSLPTEEELAKSPAAQFQRGLQLYKNDKLVEAIAAFRECVNLQPDFPNARLSLGTALLDNGDLEEAAVQLEQVVAAEHEKAQAHNALGLAYSRLGRTADAVGCFERAIDLQADYADAHYNLGQVLLLRGDYARGLVELDWRWKTGRFSPMQCPQPQWDGTDIGEKTLLLHTEQDVSEAIQHACKLLLTDDNQLIASVCGQADIAGELYGLTDILFRMQQKGFLA